MKVVFCLPGNTYTRGFFESWLKLDTYCKEQGIDAIVSTAGGSNVSKVRERCVRPFKAGSLHPDTPFFGEIEYDYIMWIDSDIIFEPIQFEKLLNRKVDIVAGLYATADGHFACAVDESTPMPASGELAEAEWVGMGFMLVKKGVFERIEPPWFQTTVVEGKFVTEDVYFCAMARKSGFKIYLDPDVVVRHIKEQVL